MQAAPPVEDQPKEEISPDDHAQLMAHCVDKGKHQFLQAHGPFIYITLMGVLPDKQGRGLGSRLLTEICAIADREKRWCCLETILAKNVALYNKHGFVTEFTSMAGPGAPLMQHMARPPQ